MMRQYVIRAEMTQEAAKAVSPAAKVLRGHTVFPVSERDPVPSLPPGGYWRLEMEESGGGLSNRGHATCVASVDGEPLVPSFCPKGRCGGTHAYFLGTAFAVASVGRYRDERGVNLSVVSIDTNGEVSSKELWAGRWNALALNATEEDWKKATGLPESLDRYAGLIRATSRKAGCYHCREVHFAKSK